MKPLAWHIGKAAIEIADYIGFHEPDELEAIRGILARNFTDAHIDQDTERELRGVAIAASLIKDGETITYDHDREMYHLGEYEGATLRHLFWVMGGKS